MNRGEFDKDFEKVFEAPAELLEEGIEFAEKEEKVLISKKPFKLAEEYWDTLGPGLTTGAADDDPSGIATYSQAGAQYGLQLIWLSLFTYPFMATVQEMCARIGIVSGQGLAANIRKHYPARTLYVVTALLFFANALNIAADLGAMSAATRLLLPHVGFELLVIFFALVSLGLQIFTTYARYAKYLKYLTLALLSYVAVAFSVGLDWGDVLHHTLIPTLSFTKDQIFLVCAVLGTTISPYLFFWQTSQEVEEQILKGEVTVAERRAQVSPQSLRRMRTDVWSGMFFSNLVTFFIFAACAGTLYAHGITNIATADQAALALRPFGDFAFLLFAVGIVGTGLLAVPVLAGSTAYALSESFGWTNGLYHKLDKAYAFYGVIIVSMLLGIAANFVHLDPIKALIYAAVANGVIAPVVLFFVVRLSSNTQVMGEHTNRPLVSKLGWLTILFMAVSGIAAIATLFL
ncbi:MAG: divalent metal cation transporter [Candidatus Paceibacterota bacterium]|jgi:NRAMP (natural resistance-associated macrophage protein)-like metal ion transporter